MQIRLTKSDIIAALTPIAANLETPAPRCGAVRIAARGRNRPADTSLVALPADGGVPRILPTASGNASSLISFDKNNFLMSDDCVAVKRKSEGNFWVIFSILSSTDTKNRRLFSL